MVRDPLTGAGPTRPILVANVIIGLNLGGAEIALHRLMTRLNRAHVTPVVISLTARGVIGDRLEESGVEVISLESSRRSIMSAIPRLVGVLRKLRPQIVQTWMYHADLFGGIAASLAGRPPVVWGIRSALEHPREAGRITRHVIKACALSSRWIPDRIVSVSESGRRIHASWGYPADRIAVIPNGFDLAIFSPNEKKRAEFRREIGASEESVVVTNVGRVHPHKDHATLLNGMARLWETERDIHLVIAGDDTDQALTGLVHGSHMHIPGDRLHLLGPRHDVARILSGTDIYCSSSIAEAFPNSVGEAMSSEVPCVVTDVGDSAQLVGETGVVVRRGDPSALAAGVESLVRLDIAERQQLGQRARERIALNYDIQRVAACYESLYMELTR